MPQNNVQFDYERERRSFDGAAEAYEAHRPGYPRELVERILAEAQIGDGSAVLEVGCGTGKATAPFARMGCSMLCLDPGPNLIATARRKFAALGNIRFECVRFEDWDLERRSFDLVFSAQAFHWVAPDVGLRKADEALKPGGHLALFWNLYPGMSGALAERLQRAYDAHAPHLAERRPDLEAAIAKRRKMLEPPAGELGAFEAAREFRFPWSQRYSTQEYIGLLNTYSDHICLEARAKEQLLNANAEAIDAHGGMIERPYVAVLFVCRKR